MPDGPSSKILAPRFSRNLSSALMMCMRASLPDLREKQLRRFSLLGSQCLDATDGVHDDGFQKLGQPRRGAFVEPAIGSARAGRDRLVNRGNAFAVAFLKHEDRNVMELARSAIQ